MTNIAQTVASKAIVALVAAAMIFTMFAPAAKAQTTEELQKMINDLMAQIAALQGGGGAVAGTPMAGGVCPFTWTRDLNVGATGADVMKLQQFLNSNADTRVAASGAGSVGAETEFYGPATAAAVSKMQVMYRADILTPGGLVNPTGYFGPSTRNKANALCVASTGTTTPDGEDDEDEDDSELQGEGELDTFEMDDASDTDIQEGAEDEVIAEITMEATDGDIEVDRMTFTIVGNSTEEEDPWEVFETITLWVDGEEIASFEADDEDNYLDEDAGEFRFSGLGLVLSEDEEVEVMVGASVASSVDGADNDDSEWTVKVTDVRYFDADGVATDDNDTDGIDADTAVFDIVEAGDGEELTFSLGTGNPDATDIVVDTDNTTDGVTVLEYTIEAEDGDIELDTLFVTLVTSATTSLIVDDIVIEVDGQTFKDEATVVNSTTSSTYEFDIDGDVVVEDGEEVTVKVMVDFQSQESSNNVARYANGSTIKANAEVNDTVAEGNSDDPSLKGSAVGDTHTVVAEGIVIPVDSVEFTTDTTGENDTLGVFTIEFEVTGVEGDFYILDQATSSATAVGVEFTVDGSAATTSGTLTSSADEETDGVFTVREGETETFTLRVTVDPTASGDFRVTLSGVNFSENVNGTSSPTLYTPTPVQDFRTGYETVQGS